MSLLGEEEDCGETIVSHITQFCSLQAIQAHAFEKQCNKATRTL